MSMSSSMNQKTSSPKQNALSKYKFFQEHPSILTVMVLSIFALALASFFEILGACCFPLKHFMIYGLVWTAILLPFLLYHPSVRKTSVLLLFWTLLLVLYLVPWNSRKHFLHDLDKVRVGMTESQVRAVMSQYIEGTGWPASPQDNSSNTLREVSTGASLQTEVSKTGELAIRNSLVFRHSEDAAFNSDWGLIYFENGHVVGTDFMPD